MAFDAGTYKAASSSGYNDWGIHPAWLLDVNELVVSSVVDADHVIFSLYGTPWNTTGLPSFASVFNNSGAGAPSIAGFNGKMYYQSDAAGGNTAWSYSGSWIHIGANGNGLTGPTLYKHTNCDYSYWVDQFGPQGSPGKNLWVFPQELFPNAAKPQWRAEIKPSVPATTDYFLNVLTPTSTSNSSGPTTVSISAAGWHGAQVSDGIETFVAMFPETAGEAGVTYTATHSGGGKHVVTGLTASTSYPVTQNGSSIGSFTSDASGGLTFTETGGGSFTVGLARGATSDARIAGKAAASGNVVLR